MLKNLQEIRHKAGHINLEEMIQAESSSPTSSTPKQESKQEQRRSSRSLERQEREQKDQFLER